MFTFVVPFPNIFTAILDSEHKGEPIPLLHPSIDELPQHAVVHLISVAVKV